MERATEMDINTNARMLLAQLIPDEGAQFSFRGKGINNEIFDVCGL